MILCVFLMVQQLMAAHIVPLEGDPVSAESITFLASDQIQVGEQAFALAACDVVVLGAGDTHVATDYERWVILADGSWLPAWEVTAAGSDVIMVRSPYGDFRFSFGEIIAWGDAKWLRQRDGQHDAILLESGRFVGTCLGLDNGSILMDLPGLGEQGFAINQVQALSLAIEIVPRNGVYLALRTAAGLPSTYLYVKNGALVVGPESQQPVHHLKDATLRVHGGQRRWLSALEPSAVHEEGAFGVVWPYSRDANIDGSRLQLGDIIYDRGLVIHSRARLTWTLAGKYRRFRAIVGISDIGGDHGDCSVHILGDDKVLWQSNSVRGDSVPEWIDCDLSGVQQLTVFVDYGARYDIADHFVLADAWLIFSD